MYLTDFNICHRMGTADVVLHIFYLHFQCQTFSCYAFAIEIVRRQWIVRADLPRLHGPRRGVALVVIGLPARLLIDRTAILFCLSRRTRGRNTNL